MKRIVLARPEGPRNVGSVLRAATNFGPAEIWIVAPKKPSLLIHPDFEQMSHGVENAAEQLRVVDTMEEALAECTWSIGFTARQRGHRTMLDWRDVQRDSAERIHGEDERCALVFGNEVTGLKGSEAALCNELVHIATSAEHTSLNLAMAVTVVMYSVFQAPPTKARSRRGEPLVGSEREYLRLHAQETLAAVATSDSIRDDIRASAERVFAQAPLETRDARAWHAIFRALGNKKSPLDYGLPGTGSTKRRPE